MKMNRMLSISFQIKNIKKPICINCVNFISPENNYPWDDMPNDELQGKCAKYGFKHLITGKIHYDYAINIRQDKTKCGEDGSLFEEIKTNK